MESYYTENRSCGNQKHVKTCGDGSENVYENTENMGNGEDVYGLHSNQETGAVWPGNRADHRDGPYLRNESDSGGIKTGRV